MADHTLKIERYTKSTNWNREKGVMEYLENIAGRSCRMKMGHSSSQEHFSKHEAIWTTS